MVMVEPERSWRREAVVWEGGERRRREKEEERVEWKKSWPCLDSLSVSFKNSSNSTALFHRINRITTIFFFLIIFILSLISNSSILAGLILDLFQFRYSFFSFVFFFLILKIIADCCLLGLCWIIWWLNCFDFLFLIKQNQKCSVSLLLLVISSCHWCFMFICVLVLFILCIWLYWWFFAVLVHLTSD